MFLGDRTNELLFRASKREVTAIVTISLPGIDPKASPESFGSIIEGRKLFTPKASTATAFSQAATVWQFNDNCVPVVERDPVSLQAIREQLHDRTKRLNAGEFKSLDDGEQIAVFESEDIIARATGIPAKLHITFSDSVEKAVLAVSVLPFGGLKKYIGHLLEKAAEAGGQLHDVAVTHVSALSAVDYYNIATKTYYPGHRFSSGNKALVTGNNGFVDMGVAVENNSPKPRYH